MEEAERALFENGIRHATEADSGAALDAALDDLGWRDALCADHAGAISVLFESLGAAHATSSALDWLLAHELGDGDGSTAVVLPPLRHCDPPGQVGGDRCLVQGLGTEALGRSDTVLVVAGTPVGFSAFAVATEALKCRPVLGLDPALGLFEVTGDFDAETADHESVDWDGAVALGHLALGSELVGAGRAMLELARVHALERIQFGRPIATFQAVRHRLAEGLVTLEAASALLDAAGDDPSPVTAAMAKAFAGRSARSAARHCQQVLAGIGFTTEHPLHFFVRRTMVLDQLLGAGSALTKRLGSDIVRNGTLPLAFPL
jgi:Acyl-CoA dehydrogenase, C-terminal domain